MADPTHTPGTRFDVAFWRRDFSRRHNDAEQFPCLGGACNGDGGKCARHQRTGELISRLIRLRLRRREQLNQERAAKARIEAHHRRLPCHPDDYPCDADGHVCFRHAETKAYVRRAFVRLERMRARRSP